jgi:hypothetical protein
MASPRALPSNGELLRLFRYDEASGTLCWRYRPEMDGRWNGRFAGQTAGRTGGQGYSTVSIHGVPYAVHRIIFKMVYGEQPALIDHVDRNKKNNRHTNLRSGTKAKNGANSKDRVRDLPRGVFRCCNSKINPYRAQLKNEHLGCFPTPEAASAAFRAAQKEKYGEFAHAGS